MIDQLMPYILMGVGILGFELAGRKIWWAWYVNIANQVLWLVFALITGYWGFVVGTIFYTYQFSRNAHKWTKEHFEAKDRIFEEELAKQPPLTQVDDSGEYSPTQIALRNNPNYLGGYCANLSRRWGYACVRDGGHEGQHGYAGMFWTDEEGDYTTKFNGRIISPDE